MGGSDDYRNCCRTAAADDPGATFCTSCGQALFRCPAADCRRLVTPLGHCAACVDLRLSLEKNAIVTARLGDCLSVPFALRNNASVRPLSIRSVLRDGTNLPQQAVPITWEQLDAERTRAFAVATGPFANSGINSLRLTIVATAAFGEVEETYAFSGDLAIEVEGADATQVVQNFNLTDADFGTAGMIVASPHAAANRRPRQADALRARTDIALERAERFEVAGGYRGYERLTARIPRNVEFLYAGFPAVDRPPDGPWLQGPVLRCGRNGRAGDPRQNAEPNDLCLRIYDPASGELDREASTVISRRVCDFVLQNDRLNLRPVGGGLALNGERLDAGSTRVVNDGDVVTVQGGRGKALAIGTTFRVSSGLVTQVRFAKAS